MDCRSEADSLHANLTAGNKALCSASFSTNANAPAASAAGLTHRPLSSDHDDFRSRKHARELPAHVDAVHVRHVQVEEDDVWLQPCGLFEHPRAVLDSSDDLVVVRHEQSPNRRADSCVVVSHQNSTRPSRRDLGPGHLTYWQASMSSCNLESIKIDALSMR